MKIQKIKGLDQVSGTLKAQGLTVKAWHDENKNTDKQISLQFVHKAKEPTEALDPNDGMRLNSCCGPIDHKAEKDRRFIRHMVTGTHIVGDRSFPQVGTQLTLKDRLGSLGARLGYKRDDYEIAPGLYALGEPDGASLVLVTANYKMSFDALRKELSGYNLWILVLDTFGINVWCAAGKGTFGTKELISRIQKTQLGEVVDHRKLILPQLGGPGVAGFAVKKATGFSVIFGPVRASDLPLFLKNDLLATKTMRQVTFTLKERIVLAPLEMIQLLKPVSVFVVILFALRYFGLFPRLFENVLPFLGAALVGTLCVPIFLPILPGRAFSIKGLAAGLAYSMVVFYLVKGIPLILMGSYGLLFTSIITFAALNFTGASTYTSFSGVKAEMEIAIPALVIATGLGALLLIVYGLQQIL